MQIRCGSPGKITLSVQDRVISAPARDVASMVRVSFYYFQSSSSISRALQIVLLYAENHLVFLYYSNVLIIIGRN